MSTAPGPGLTVAVTGPTGEIGKPFIAALERTREVARVRGMARRAFHPAAEGWRKTTYVRGDVTQRDDVQRLVEGADVVVHLAFVILQAGAATRLNLEGSRTVFEAAVAAGAKRLVYTSSVAAYGFHPDHPELLTEDMPARGTNTFPYSAQKAEVERVLDQALDDAATQAYVFRPCIVAGPRAPLLLESLPYVRLAERTPPALRRLLDRLPVARPVLPDPGVPFQLVHHDDVAAALRAAVLGRGEPGVYNLAAEGSLTLSDLAEELEWYAIPLPELAVDATAEVVARLPFLPPEASWITALRRPVLMDSGKARRALRWRPRHDALQTLRATIAAHRERQGDVSPATRDR
ncbi:MAG TPA: NAD-dependent epimerase/dehydratase family protein [Solirubrobacteraceae bacterium]|nr:NAD-dependent epimerase/dehydratase family protein [Solirubrobacteraceae bacterium]